MLEREVEKELLSFCRATNVGLLPYFCLANGLLAGRYKQGAPPPADSRAAAFERTRRYLDQYATPENYVLIDKLTGFVQERGHTLADLAIAWLLAEPVPLEVRDGRPWYGSRLDLGAECERIETGWWDGGEVSRDYFVAVSRVGSRLWVYRELDGGQQWYLHGFF